MGWFNHQREKIILKPEVLPLWQSVASSEYSLSTTLRDEVFIKFTKIRQTMCVDFQIMKRHSLQKKHETANQPPQKF